MKPTQRSTDPAREGAQTDPADADFVAVERCFDAYGADIDKWPADKRARLGALAASAELAAAREAAASLDGFLYAATAPHASADLKNRIAAQYVPPTPARAGLGVLAVILRPLPAGAAAGLGALGFAAGLATSGQASLAPEYEAYAYMEEAATLAMLDEEEAAAWDGD